MIELPKTKIWHGDGFASNPVTLTQIQRTETVAWYERTGSDGKFGGYEVFIVKIRHKGDPLPGGMVEENDREVYPSASQFGKTAWHIWSKTAAEAKYNELVQKGIDATAVDEDGELISEKKKELVIPVGEFSTKEFSEFNHIAYPIASIFIKDSVNRGQIKFLREERRNVKGKMTKLFGKV